MSKLAYKRTNVYETADEKTMKEIFAYAERYKTFIDAAKTEREACAFVAAEAEKQGYTPYEFGTKLKPGDKGVVRFFDDDIDLYKNSGVLAKSDEVKVHDLNDNLFEFGFYPAPENYIYPDGDLVIGTRAGALISLSNNNINISGGSINISGSSVNLGSNVVIDGKNFLEHQHSNGNQGANTGAVV